MSNHKRNFFILGALFGVFFCVSAGVVYLNMPFLNNSTPKEISVRQALESIRNNEFKEADFHNSEVEFIDNNENQYFSTIGSEATRESIYRELIQLNEASRNPIKITERPQQSGLFLLVLINFLPFLIIGFCFIFSLYWYLSSKTKNKDLK